jgi:hypothetical protein
MAVLRTDGKLGFVIFENEIPAAGIFIEPGSFLTFHREAPTFHACIRIRSDHLIPSPQRVRSGLRSRFPSPFGRGWHAPLTQVKGKRFDDLIVIFFWVGGGAHTKIAASLLPIYSFQIPATNRTN